MLQFQGFKPAAMQRMAKTMGYSGDMKEFDKFLSDNPDKQDQMNVYSDKAKEMMMGGYVKGYAEGGLIDPRIGQTPKRGANIPDWMVANPNFDPNAAYATVMRTYTNPITGETFDGSILLGRKGGAQNPNEVRISLDGKALVESQYELIPGGIKLKVDAGRPGDHKISGDLVFKNNGMESRIPVDQMYSVIAKPNSAVISADKMNVVYRGVANPMTISIPGIPDNKISASAPGLKRLRGSKFIMNPGKGREIKITASGTLPDGQRVSTSTKFRIKDIPRPTGTVRGQMGTIKIPKNNLSIATIGAVLDDFDFDIKLKTVSFKFKVPGQATISVNGNKLNTKAKGALRRAKAGQSVQIFDIKVQNPNNPSYRFKKVSPVICEIVN